MPQPKQCLVLEVGSGRCVLSLSLAKDKDAPGVDVTALTGTGLLRAVE